MSKEHDIARRVCDDAVNSGKKYIGISCVKIF